MEEFVSHFMHPAAQANDAGQFRFSGLPAGEYRVSAALEIDETSTDAVFGSTHSYSSYPTYELPIFSESTARAKDAQTIKLADGQTESSIGIEIPLSKLHGISGMLVEEGTAHRINAGKITLVYADDNTQLASADVSPEDEAFHLPYVPEGTYTIKVSEAKEVSRTVVSNGPGFFPPTHIETKVIRTFGDTTQPLIVTTDVQGLIISVPAAKPTPTP